MFLKENVQQVEDYEKGCTAESILESLIEFQESFEEAKYEIIQLEYEKTMLESSQEYLEEAMTQEQMKNSQEKASDKSAEEGKESYKDKAAKIGANISASAGKMKETVLRFLDTLWNKIKGAFYGIISKSEKSWTALMTEVSKKEKVKIVKDSAFGLSLLAELQNATSENIAEVQKKVSELTATKEEVTGSEAASIIGKRKQSVLGAPKAFATKAEAEINKLKAELKAVPDTDGEKISELKKRISVTANLNAKKVASVNQLVVKLYSASK